MSSITVDLSGLEKLIENLGKIPQEGGVKAGVLANERAGAGEVLDYAPIQEFGGSIVVTDKMRGYLGAVHDVHLKKTKTTIVIPPRPFLRITCETKANEWVECLAKGINKGIDESTLWELMGTRMQDDIKETIRSNVPPENSAMTKKFKKENYPTHENDTLRMSDKLHNSIDYEVL